MKKVHQQLFCFVVVLSLNKISFAASCDWGAEQKWLSEKVESLKADAQQKGQVLEGLTAAGLQETMCSYRPWVTRAALEALNQAFEKQSPAKISLKLEAQNKVVGQFAEFRTTLFSNNAYRSYKPTAFCYDKACREPALIKGRSGGYRPGFEPEELSIKVPQHLKNKYSFDWEGFETRSYKGKFVVPKADLTQFAKSFALTREYKPIVREIKKYVVASGQSNEAEVRIPLDFLLPHMVLKRLNKFPEGKIVEKGSSVNSFGTVRAFFKHDVEKPRRHTNKAQNLDAIVSRYYQEQAPGASYHYGDIVQDRLSPHAVRVLFTDRSGVAWTMSKENAKETSAWRLLPLGEAFRIGQVHSGSSERKIRSYEDLFHFRKVR